MSNLFHKPEFVRGLEALKADLVHEDGPRISTMRNYRFAIVPYPPTEEFHLRREVERLSSELVEAGWHVLPISLESLLIERLRALGDDALEATIRREKRTARRDPARALRYLRDRLSPLIEGPDGLAADICSRIEAFVQANPSKAERTLVLLARAGGLYPFIRCSALLKHVDGRTCGLPVVLLYPGEPRGDAGLSFMGVLNADRDYRPRIYP